MTHLGDITKMDGTAAPPVNVIIGGSPCQDLSCAGRRAGLAGERSGLFMEQIRIIKEMRKADADSGRTGVDIRPRYMVWENVPGAFSSNKGADFGAILQETVRIVCEKAPAVPVPRNGWPTAGCLTEMGGKWSIAWRVFDAQFWGVPQRRRRIALVADFGGTTAPEILFERESVSGDSAPGGTPRERTAADIERSVGAAGGDVTSAYCIQGNCIDRADTAGCNGKGWTEDVSYTLNTVDRPAVCGFSYKAGSKANGIGYEDDMSPTLSAQRHDASVLVIENHPQDSRVKLSEDNIVQTLSRKMGTGGGNTPMVMETFSFQSFGDYKKSDVASTCKTRGCGDMSDLICAAVDCRNGTENPDVNGTLQAKEGGGMSLNLNNVVREHYLVRHMTPLECERLQGFPDGWTDIGEWADTKGKVHKPSDSARYKALGNSIALPPWMYVLSKLSRHCADRTMASLFDGIGGFPLIWETLNGKGTCLWASEIEEFPIAVTKRHFADEMGVMG